MEKARYLIVGNNFHGTLDCTGIITNVKNVNRFKVPKRVKSRNCRNFSRANSKLFIRLDVGVPYIRNGLFYVKFCLYLVQNRNCLFPYFLIFLCGS